MIDMIKVVCEDNDDYPLSLTVGKTYDVEELYSIETEKYIGYKVPIVYELTDDVNDIGWYSVELFKPLSEIREEKINLIFNE